MQLVEKNMKSWLVIKGKHQHQQMDHLLVQEKFSSKNYAQFLVLDMMSLNKQCMK